MQAIILAAGMGKRLGDLTNDNTKCMVSVNELTLIERMLSQLNKYIISRIIIVIGYEGQKLKDFIGSFYTGVPIIYVENPQYDRTNNIYSLFLARDYMIEEDTLLLESDIIFEDSVLEKLLNASYPNLALVAKFEYWMDGTVVVLDDEDNILDFVTKKGFKYENSRDYFKTVNLYKFSRKFSSNYYVPFLESYSKALGNNEYYEEVIKVITLLDKPEIKALRLEEEKWYEIDDIQDLDIAEVVFAPKDKQLSLLQSRFGGYWRFPRLLDFCYLVNPFFPGKKLLSEVNSNLSNLIIQYPSGMSVNSLLAAKFFSVKQDYIVVGNGAGELISSLIRMSSGKKGVVFPTFEEYPNRMSKDEIVPYLPSNDDFSYSADDIMNFFSDKGISLLILINPDNPSGNFIPLKDILSLLDWSGKIGIQIIIDESFVDFSDDSYQNTLLKNATLASNPQLIVVKSISKSYGVPGLRLGVIASSDINLIKDIRQDISIWNINSIAEFFMQIFNKYENDYKTACKLFSEERDRFFHKLKMISYLRVIRSQANYFLCEVKAPFTARSLTLKLHDQANILIKDCSKKEGFNGREFVRIAIKGKFENGVIIKELQNYETD